MIQFLSTLEHLIRDPSKARDYTWFVHLEHDHFFRPRLLRRAIAEEILSGRMPKGAVLLGVTNFFAFNAEMLREMGKQWDVVGKRIRDSGGAKEQDSPVGCPTYSA